MKLIKDLGNGYQIVQYGTWQAWGKDGNYSSSLANELEQEIGKTLLSTVHVSERTHK